LLFVAVVLAGLNAIKLFVLLMLWENKLGCLSESVLIFACNFGRLPINTVTVMSFTCVGSCLTDQYQSRLKRLANDKRSRFFSRSIVDVEKKVL